MSLKQIGQTSGTRPTSAKPTQTKDQNNKQFDCNNPIQQSKTATGYYPNKNNQKEKIIQNEYQLKILPKHPDTTNYYQKLDENKFLSNSQKQKLSDFMEKNRSISAHPAPQQQKCNICQLNILYTEQFKLNCQHYYHRQCLNDTYYRSTNTKNVKCLVCQRNIEESQIRKFIKSNTTLFNMIYQRELCKIMQEHAQYFVKCRFCEFFCIISKSYFEKEITGYCAICLRYTIFDKCR